MKKVKKLLTSINVFAEEKPAKKEKKEKAKRNITT